MRWKTWNSTIKWLNLAEQMVNFESTGGTGEATKIDPAGFFWKFVDQTRSSEESYGKLLETYPWDWFISPTWMGEFLWCPCIGKYIYQCHGYGMGMETSPKKCLRKNPGGNSTPKFYVNFNDFIPRWELTVELLGIDAELHQVSSVGGLRLRLQSKPWGIFSKRSFFSG